MRLQQRQLGGEVRVLTHFVGVGVLSAVGGDAAWMGEVRHFVTAAEGGGGGGDGGGGGAG